jgi:uncharacterized protein (DUF736 family)
MALQSIGALWLKDGKAGKFMSGNLEINGQKVQIMVFKNTKKADLKQPDYRIVQSTDEVTRPAVQVAQPAPELPVINREAPSVNDEIKVEDIIPF